MSTPQRARGGPLDGVRVLDLSSVVAGPWATHVLAGFGADVIKVEPPDGDIMRYAPPARHRGMGAEFVQMNGSKRSVALDLKRDADRGALLALCAHADVLVHNVRPAAMRRLRLDYDDVAAANPAIVYVSIVGFDQSGPYAARPAYDDLIQGASGLASLFPAAGGGEPRYVPSLIVDRISGLSAVNAILAALVERGRSGIGQALEVPMFETMAELVLADHLGGHTFEPPAGPFGYSRVLTPYRRPYRTSDGYVCVLLYNERHWERFFTAAGRFAEYAADPKLSDDTLRRQDYDYAYGLVAEILATRTSAEWLALLETNDIPVMPLNDIPSLVDDPQLTATAFFTTTEHPTEGTLRTMRTPTRWSRSPQTTPSPAPRLGEHTADVLRAAGVDEAQIAAILARENAPPARNA
ncbi:MAG: CoA transferase [Candidatus Eremiobacteraeota bacterium]|nr:CoA transferase [Candidatus Eremiobacteraeota bacterium]